MFCFVQFTLEFSLQTSCTISSLFQSYSEVTKCVCFSNISLSNYVKEIKGVNSNDKIMDLFRCRQFIFAIWRTYLDIIEVADYAVVLRVVLSNTGGIKLLLELKWSSLKYLRSTSFWTSFIDSFTGFVLNKSKGYGYRYCS